MRTICRVFSDPVTHIYIFFICDLFLISDHLVYATIDLTKELRNMAMLCAIVVVKLKYQLRSSTIRDFIVQYWDNESMKTPERNIDKSSQTQA